MYIRINRASQINMRVSASECVLCLNDDDDEDIVGLCDEGTYVTARGTEQQHGVCRACLPTYIDRNPWDCLVCRRPYGLRFMRERARMRGEIDESLESLNEPSWASAPMVSVTDIHISHAPAFMPEASMYGVSAPSLYGNDAMMAGEQLGAWHAQPAASLTTFNAAFPEQDLGGTAALNNLSNVSDDRVIEERSENVARNSRRENRWLQAMANVRRRRGER